MFDIKVNLSLKQLFSGAWLWGVFIGLFWVELTVRSVSAEPLALEGGLAERAALLVWPGQSEGDLRFNHHAAIVTDRPNFTEASTTVGRGVTQLEFGYLYSSLEGGEVDRQAHYYPEAALRQGVLANWLELRLGQSLVSYDGGGDSGTELDNTYLGTKLALTSQFGLLPRLALVSQVALPTGSGEARADHVLPGVHLVYYWGVSADAYLVGTTKFDRIDSAGEVNVASVWSQSAVVGLSASDSVGLFAEWFAVFEDSLSGSDQHFADCGATYLLTNDLQLDIRIGSRLQDRFGEDILSGAGISFRL